MDLHIEEKLLDELLDFQIPIIDENKRFWMIRTKGGYFYNEFISRKFVALAWNNINKETDLDNQAEILKDNIIVTFPEIKRPSGVISKCKNFINEVKEGDILVIPNKGSKDITFALAGKYYEDSTKTVELEKTVIYRIDKNDVEINDVTCPYKKRRKITLLKTIKSEDINFTLYRAISNYHGISSLDAYSNHILNELYNYYSFKGDVAIVYNVRKRTSIKPRELSGLLYGNTECLANIIPEDYVSTQIAVSSPGEIVYILRDAYEFAKDNWGIIFGLLVFLGGGSAMTFKVNGVVDIVKNILNAKSEIRQVKAEADNKELDVIKKRIEVLEKLKESGISLSDLEMPLETVAKSSASLEAEPIILMDEIPGITLWDDEVLESTDINKE